MEDKNLLIIIYSKNPVINSDKVWGGGTNSPRRRIKQIENIDKEIINDADKNEHTEESKEETLDNVSTIFMTENLSSESDSDHQDGELHLPFPVDISKLFEIQLHPQMMNENNREKDDKDNGLVNHKASGCKVLVATSVQCDIDSNGSVGDTNNNIESEDWSFVPNSLLRQPLLLGHFSKKQSTDIIRVCKHSTV